MITKSTSDSESNPDRESKSDSRGLLWTVVLLAAGAAGALWGASTVIWGDQRYRGLSGERTAEITGSMLRPELSPIALAALAAIAAVLATAGLLRRLIGILLVAFGVLLGWRSADLDFGRLAGSDELPAGSVPIGELALSPVGPILMGLGGLGLLLAGGLTLLRAHRMPAMGSRYSAPGEAKKKDKDPDKQLWDALDADQDPTDDDRDREANSCSPDD